MEDTIFSFPGVAVWRQERLGNKSEDRDVRAPGRKHTQEMVVEWMLSERGGVFKEMEKRSFI